MMAAKEKTCPFCGEKYQAEEIFYKVKVTLGGQKKSIKLCEKCVKRIVAEVFCGKKSPAGTAPEKAGA